LWLEREPSQRAKWAMSVWYLATLLGLQVLAAIQPSAALAHVVFFRGLAILAIRSMASSREAYQCSSGMVERNSRPVRSISSAIALALRLEVVLWASLVLRIVSRQKPPDGLSGAAIHTLIRAIQ
jgi:hypothetical protein